ncbi:MAG: hypothetical protein P1P84_17260 [Deferrisomatales bacterium]|nr:hypothetical protein [Deferrisomatales bacterium]
MKNGVGSPWAALLATAALLASAGCAPPIRRLPEPPPPRPATTPAPTVAPTVAPAVQPRPGATAAGERRARELRQRGDLAAALIQWRILRTLAPGDPGVQRQLAATQALIRQRVREKLAAGTAAERAGETARAREAYLQALALDPSDADALANLRSMETDAVFAVQQARLDKLLARRAQAAARKPEGQTAPAVPHRGASTNGQERDYRDMGTALFEAGDYEASILELKKYLGSFPEDDAARDILHKAEARARKGNPPDEVPLPQAPPPGMAGGNAPPRPPTAATAVPALPVAAAAVTAADEEAAQDLYEQGVRASRQDIGEAIRLWEQSLERDPDHVQARLRLEQAQKMQQRLEAIDRQ